MKSILRIVFLAVGAVCLLCCTVPKSLDDSSLKQFVGKTVEEVLSYVGVSYDAIKLHDEPPGNLASLSFSTFVNSRKEEVRLWIVSNTTLFSIERKWDPEVVKKARVVRVRLGSDKAVTL